MEIKEKLVFICKKIRTSPMPIADIIPTLQEARDKIEELEAQIVLLKYPEKVKIAALLKPPADTSTLDYKG